MPASAPPQPRPPAAPEGWLPGPPDYVGVGTVRSGTGWWHSLIRAHPAVSHAPGAPAEIHFFDDFWAEELDERAIERYRAFFARPYGQRSGEWTPGYMLDAWTPRLLRRAAPDARLLVLLRDPVERFRSERRAEDRQTVGATARAAANGAFSRGLYADQLLRLWGSFPREQVLVLQYERCVADPRAELEQTFEHIGLEPVISADLVVAPPLDEGPGSEVALSAWQEDQLVRRYASENERLAALVPELDLSLWQAPS